MENNWTSVTEKLPPPYEGQKHYSPHLLVRHREGMSVAYYLYDSMEWILAHGADVFILKGVTCWMPLPKK